MKRRDFLRASASLTGAVIPAAAWSQTKPCPPPALSVQGGTASSTGCVQPTGGLADWDQRASAAGVLWAHRFNNPNAKGLYWGQGVDSNSSGRRIGYISESATQTGASGVRAEKGVLGDGCMEFYIPAGASTGSFRWGRPLAPVTGIPAQVQDSTGKAFWTADATGPDVNKPGLPGMDWSKFYSSYTGDPSGKQFNAGGGVFCHPADLEKYQRAIPANSYTTAANEITYAGAGGFYIQYRVKYKTLPNGDNRLNYGYPGSGLPASSSKSWILGNIANAAPNHEIVSVVRPESLQNAHGMYGAIGAWWYGDTNRSPGSYKIQPGHSDACSITDVISCWKYPKDKWITVLIHVVPGRQNPPPTSAGWDTWLASIATSWDGGIEVWVADEDDIAAGRGYKKIHSALNKYAWYYDAKYPNGSNFSLVKAAGAAVPQAPGFSWFEILPYANPGGTQAQPYVKDIWLLYDQLVCSTQFIACPTV